MVSVETGSGRAANIVAFVKDSGYVRNIMPSQRRLSFAMNFQSEAPLPISSPMPELRRTGLMRSMMTTAVNPCGRPSGGGWTSSIRASDGELKTNWQTEHTAVKQNKAKYHAFTSACYDLAGKQFHSV